MSEISTGGGRTMRRRRTVREHGPDPVDVHVGKRLRQARLLAGLSQEELGDGIGVSFQAVQKYEQGENRLSASRLFRAAKLLQQPVSFFFELLEGDPPDAAAAAATFSRDEIDLVRHYRLIDNQEVREHLLLVTKRVGDLGGGAVGSVPGAAKPA
ncbi:MAG TPA: helix-turn-helix transcriptional regulator [Stellaceae bacterium]|nr:helix-turn-helix transcriptional regulator [Stellaceae bacterium]